MKKLIYLFVLISGIISCSSDDESKNHTLNGIYTETSPINGRSQLNFVDKNTVIQSESGSSTENEFIYELNGNIIKLTPTWNNQMTTELEIEIMNNSKFKVENLYPIFLKIQRLT